MKKFLVVSILMALGFVSYAQIVSGSCKLPGTYDYVNVNYYEDGHLAVSNQSGMMITQLHIKVTYRLTRKRPEIAGDVPVIVNVTAVDQDYYDIEPNKTTYITDGVKGCPFGRYQEKRYKNGEFCIWTTDNWEIEVGNQICR